MPNYQECLEANRKFTEEWGRNHRVQLTAQRQPASHTRLAQGDSQGPTLDEKIAASSFAASIIHEIERASKSYRTDENGRTLTDVQTRAVDLWAERAIKALNQVSEPFRVTDAETAQINSENPATVAALRARARDDWQEEVNRRMKLGNLGFHEAMEQFKRDDPAKYGKLLEAYN